MVYRTAVRERRSEVSVREFETIIADVRDGVCWVTLNRPQHLNAFTAKMQEELREVWREMRVDDDIRVAVITGAGRAFCAGVDRDQPMTAMTDKPFGTSNPYMYDDPGEDLGPKSCDLWKPVIAAVNGIACGGAFYILSEVDVIIAGEDATFFDPHVTFGMAAVYEPIKMLPKMPLGEVLRMSLAGAHERIGAQRAMEIGLVSEVVAPDQLLEAAGNFARIVASQPALAIQATLRSVWMGADLLPRNAIPVAPAFLATGNNPNALREGQKAFEAGGRVKPRVR
jgi:enoyl-CoA hydratase/carnithine racemase